MKFVHNDGGRAASGHKGSCDDCAMRAAAIPRRRANLIYFHSLEAELPRFRPRPVPNLCA